MCIHLYIYIYIDILINLFISECNQHALSNEKRVQSLSSFWKLCWTFGDTDLAADISCSTFERHINPIQGGPFWGCSRMVSLKSVTHILQWWTLAVIPYLKKIQKIYGSRKTHLEFCWHQHFFTKNQKILLYQEILI